MSEGIDVPLALGFLMGHPEILIIGGVIVLLFFGRRIPGMMRSLGKSVTQFRKGLHDDDDGAEDAAEEEKTAAPKKDGEKDGDKADTGPKGAADGPSEGSGG